MPNLGWDSLLAAAGDAGKAFEPLDDAAYNFVITKPEIGQSKTGKKSIGITAIVESGPHAKRRVWHTWYISPESANALAYFFREMAVLGLDQEFWAGNPSDEKIIAGLNNRRFVGTTKVEEYNGKKKNVIDSFAAPVGAAFGNAAATLGEGGTAPSGPSAGPSMAASAPAAGPASAPTPAAAPPVAPPGGGADANPWNTAPAGPSVTSTPPPAAPGL